jgi:hypothetical protein
MEAELKKKPLSTLETQELIYKKYLRDQEIQHGKSFEELLLMANDPRKFVRTRRKKE